MHHDFLDTIKVSYRLSYLWVCFLLPMSQIFAQPWGKKFSHEIYNSVADGEMRSSSAAYALSDIGNYQGAMQLNEVALEWGLDTLDIEEEWKIIKPEDYFNTISDTVSVVIISEAHHKPQHRIFTRKILKSLYHKGFRYLGLEALTPNPDHPLMVLDSSLNERKYPLDSPLTGRYAMEPMMGQLIREALHLGFTVFGYENTSDNERDLGQALNIKKMMDENPGGKFIIHCGWYHAIESNYPKRRDDRYMAHHLKQLTGIDPLTIYQDLLSEKYLYTESPIYNRLDGPMGIVCYKTGKPFTPTEHFDIQVFHPRTKFKFGRPSFLFDNAGLKPVELPLSEYELTYPVNIEATKATEEVDATPLDRIEQISPYQNIRLVLPEGTYLINVTDVKGKELTFHWTVR